MSNTNAITVEPIEIKETQYLVKLSGKIHTLTKKQADALFEELSKALNKPPLMHFSNCSDRFSHGAHAWGKDGLNYCSGRSFDVT